jgi:amino acid permease
MVWGWFIPCIFVMCIAASMAELASSMPYVLSITSKILLSPMSPAVGQALGFIIFQRKWHRKKALLLDLGSPDGVTSRGR